jgi:hypothetical protein
MEMDPNPPTFNLKYDIGTVPDIGAGYAKGITAAGESLSKATSGVLDVMARNRNADDMLNVLHQTGVLTPDQFNAVANKGLGAKEQMTGMYANQWILDQANQRAKSLQAGQGGVDVAVEHAKMLDMLNLYKSGGPGLDQSKIPWQPPAPNPPAPNPQPQPQPNQANVQPPPGPQMPTGYVSGAGTAAQGPTGNISQIRAPMLPGSKRFAQTDSVTGKTVKGTQLPSGQFVPDQGQ